MTVTILYDWLVVTAASAAQAAGYGEQLAARRRSGALEAYGNVLVVPDPHDRRAGSGGSTLVALTEILRRRAASSRRSGRRSARATVHDLLAGQRIMIIHSGGDSRRLPAYAAQGKVFAPLPCDTAKGRQADLFDLVLDDAASISPPAEGGILITAGDVLLGLRGQRHGIQRAIAAGSPGVVGVAFRARASTGARHGVYVLDAQGGVKEFLQKPTVDQQTRAGALDSKGRALVDTGVVHIDPSTAAAWLTACGLELGAAGPETSGFLAEILSPDGTLPGIDLYHHVLGALAASVTPESYARSLNAAPGEEAFYASLFHAFHGPRFSAAVMDHCDFLHIGTTRELIELVTTDARLRRPVLAGVLPAAAAKKPRPAKGAQAKTPAAPAPGIAVYNSPALAFTAQPYDDANIPRARAVIEASDIRRISLGGENLVVGLPRELDGVVHLPKGWGISALPVGRSGWACVLFADGDDCKTSIDAGGTLGNQPLTELVARGCSMGELWPEPASERSLWTARLWHVASPRRSLDAVSWIMDPRRLAPSSWGSVARLSLAQLIRQVNHARLIEHRAALQQSDRLARLSSRVIADPWLPAADIAADCNTPARRTRAISDLQALAEKATPIEQARLKRVISELASGAVSARALQGSFEAVARAVRTDFDLPSSPPSAAILPDQVVWVTTPVRIDLAGGWSDTPPVCNELGGTVVNMAITLNGQFPVQVVARRIDRPMVRLSSVDLGRSIEFTSSRAVGDYRDPQDWAALPKAALVLAGIVPAAASTSLSAWLRRFGGGLDLTVFSALPKGSGLGTSSVLGAGILACLDRVVGREIDHQSIIRRTSVLEQMMSTAGGWQDQVGGITPGIKINRTRPGAEQTPVVTPVPLSKDMQAELASRSLLYYTGYRRLARNILQKVVGRYLSRDREAVGIIHELKDLAERQSVALAAGDVDEYARCVGQNWAFKKRLDPGSTNDAIEGIVRPLEKYLTGYEMPGAGGGGFLYMIAKDAPAARRVRAMLERTPPNDLARFFSFEIDQRALGVSVL